MEPENQTANDVREPVSLPIDGVLDLHTFRPKDVKPVVLDYIELCREKEILELRIIHGKGIGQLRATVHAILARHPFVQTYALASEAYGGSGATIVQAHGRRLIVQFNVENRHGFGIPWTKPLQL